MPQSKIKPTDYPVTIFLNTFSDPQLRADCWTITQMMMEAAQAMPIMWGTSTVGFGMYSGVDIDGKEEKWMQLGFSPRKSGIALYIMVNGLERSIELLGQLGKYTHEKDCLYIKCLADVDMKVLNELFHEAAAYKVKSNPFTTR